MGGGGSSLQDLLKLGLLRCGQGGRELNVDFDDEIASFLRSFAFGHTHVGKALFEARRSGSRSRNGQLSTFDSRHGSSPASERFFKVDIDGSA